MKLKYDLQYILIIYMFDSILSRIIENIDIKYIDIYWILYKSLK